jgi:hypothetical protein
MPVSRLIASEVMRVPNAGIQCHICSFIFKCDQVVLSVQDKTRHQGSNCTATGASAHVKRLSSACMCRLEIRKARCRVCSNIIMHDDGHGAGGTSRRLPCRVIVEQPVWFPIVYCPDLNLSTRW